MQRNTFSLAACLCGVLLVLAGCGDAASPARTPAPALPQTVAEIPRFNVEAAGTSPTSLDTTVTVLWRVQVLDAPITKTMVIGPEGGEFKIVQAGVKIEVPAGALDVPTPISITALPGWVVAYEFGPHGTQFRKPVKITQDLRSTGIYKQWLPYLYFKAGYFQQQGDIVQRRLSATVDEIVPVEIDMNARLLKFYVEHFSGYLVAVGCKRDRPTTIDEAR